ncbi:MAG TPA: GNAT family N-acetyltransferase [Tepidisphaeraceae bacterium]|jgi:GNAT superfamily N-acetyltransferase|nr:GNAT family N-acetyltransferase [Tepidisphaeraceae bacterium]
MISSLSILPAVPADLPHILRFIRGLAEYEKLAHACVANEERLTQTLFGPHPYAHVLIARLNNQPVGFALYFYNYSTFLAQPGLYLEDLFVLPEFRKQGVGRSLFTRLAQIARDQHCGRFEWSVLDWNQPAIDFYKRIGATILDDWRICRLTADQITQLAESK